MEELPEWVAPVADGEAQAREFDARLGSRTSLLVDYSPAAVRVMAEAYRAVVGLTEQACPDGEAIDRMLNPARNDYRLETLNVGVHAPLMRPLQHANFTFAKKISHTADSQDQRHRMVPGSRPLLTLTDTRQPRLHHAHADPPNPRAAKSTSRPWPMPGRRKMRSSIAASRPSARSTCCPTPNRFAWSSPARCCTLLHKWTMRTCFNAQERIYQASMEEVEQIRAVLPDVGRYLGPPCYVRAGVATPICTEGSHFCGVKVWQEFPNIERRI